MGKQYVWWDASDQRNVDEIISQEDQEDNKRSCEEIWKRHPEFKETIGDVEDKRNITTNPTEL